MGSKKFEVPSLTQAWLHSHEEDTSTSTVYRPTNYAFRPSRGRTGFNLRPDGTLTYRQPGAADQTESVDGTWKLEGEKLRLITPSGSQTLGIESLAPDRLVVSKGTCSS